MDENQTIDQDRILKINIEEEMKSSYIDYSMSVIVARALPDVRDGFKPVHRRILFVERSGELLYAARLSISDTEPKGNRG